MPDSNNHMYGMVNTAVIAKKNTPTAQSVYFFIHFMYVLNHFLNIFIWRLKICINN